VALSSEELLNVGARGIEDAGEVRGRHLDCTFSLDVTTEKDVEARRFTSGIYFSGPSELQAELCDFGTQWKFSFVESPARVCNWRPELSDRQQLALVHPLAVVLPTEDPGDWSDALAYSRLSAHWLQNLGSMLPRESC